MTREIDETEVEWLDPEELVELEEDGVDDEATTRRISGIRAKREELRARAEEALRVLREEANAEIIAFDAQRTTPVAVSSDERVLELGAALPLAKASPRAGEAALAPSRSEARWYRPLLGWFLGALRLAVFFMIGVAIGSMVAMALVELLGPRAPQSGSHPETSEVAPPEILRGERGSLPDIGKPSDAF